MRKGEWLPVDETFRLGNPVIRGKNWFDLPRGAVGTREDGNPPRRNPETRREGRFPKKGGSGRVNKAQITLIGHG